MIVVIFRGVSPARKAAARRMVVVVMEIGAGQEDELLASLKGIGLVGCKCVEDFAGIGRYLLAWRKD